MVICGLKFTHDGAIALIDNGKLIFSYEIEKLNNNSRYSDLDSIYSESFLASILQENGYSLDKVDKIVIDGWGDHHADMGKENDWLPYSVVLNKGKEDQLELKVNRYGLLVENENILTKESFNLPEKNFSYNSYMHITGHVMSAYCTSPFARREENSFVLVWDGGMFPQLFYFDAAKRSVENLGPIFHLLGYCYAGFATNYDPFNKFQIDDISIAGKVMAYIALGKCNTEVLEEFNRLFHLHEDSIAKDKSLTSKYKREKVSNLLKEFVIYGEITGAEHVDMMATFHKFLEDNILEGIKKVVDKYPHYTKNLCFVGGSALNIKWNSNIRNSGLFKEMWVPPFPNDSGSALGMACCEMISSTNHLALEWDVYRGPELRNKKVENAQWASVGCSLKQLAQILHEFDEPVVFLNNRAEMGPRALGNRSLLAAPVNKSMKGELNRVKKREAYRPVAPICLEEGASEFFLPGSPDPYMLYDHQVKEELKGDIPAVCHLDGSARLQTVNFEGNPEVYSLLQEYKKLSGIPLLCNTSANFIGKGFFPDVMSAIQWGELNIIWSEGVLYAKKGEAIHSKSNLFKMELVD